MKKLFVIIAIAVSGFVNGQLKLYGEPMFYIESEFLKKYGIENYMSVWDRYIVNDSILISNIDRSAQKQYRKKYDQFCKWNSDSSFINQPDTISNVYGLDFLIKMKYHFLPDDNPIYSFFSFNTETQYTKILGYKTFPIYQDNIKQITIVEYFEILGLDNTTLSFEIIIEYIDGKVSLFNSVKHLYITSCDYCVSL